MEIRRRTRALRAALIRSASSVGVSEPMRADFACMPSELPLVANQAPSRRRPMINRRTFTALLAGTVAAPNRAWSQHVTAKTVFYASTGPELTVFDVDAGDAALQKRSAVTLPANVQYAWPHPSKRYLYVVSSSGGPGVAGTTHRPMRSASIRVRARSRRTARRSPCPHVRFTPASTGPANICSPLTTTRATSPSIASTATAPSANR